MFAAMNNQPDTSLPSLDSMRDDHKYFWTYQGYKGASASALAHFDRDSAEWHHGMATGLGGAYDCAGMTIRPITRSEMLAGLAKKFPAGIEVVN